MMSNPTSEEIFWQACLNKDTSFDGCFIVAVRTTRIYCRPSCPARTPKRENVVFFKHWGIERKQQLLAQEARPSRQDDPSK